MIKKYLIYLICIVLSLLLISCCQIQGVNFSKKDCEQGFAGHKSYIQGYYV